MVGPGRLKSDRATNATFESLAISLADLQNQITNMQTTMRGLNRVSLSTPQPCTPLFKIAEDSDNDGVYISICVAVPPNSTNLRVEIISVNDNQKLASDASDAAALTRAKAKVQNFRLDISEEEAANQVLNRRIGPFKFKKLAKSNQFNLIRLIATNDTGALAKNPGMNPYNQAGPFTTGQQLFTPFTVDTNTNSTIFTVGTSGFGPSAPASNLLICNYIHFAGSVHTAKLTFKVWASSTNNGGMNDQTFEQLGITTVHVHLQHLALDGTPDPGSGAATDFPHIFGGPVPLSARDQTFILIDAVLPVGERYTWKRNVAGNGTAPFDSPAGTYNFYAGGNTLLSALTSVTCTAAIENIHHSIISLGFTQPGTAGQPCSSQAVLIKKYEVFESRDNGVTYLTKPVKKEHFLDQEAFLQPGAVVLVTRKVPHKARIANLVYKVRIYSLGNPAPFIEIVAAAVNSNFTFAPPDPLAADLVVNIPDGAKPRHRARTSFQVWATATGQGGGAGSTFRQIGADHAHIRVRRVRNSDVPADPATNESVAHYRHWGGPIPAADLDSQSTVITVHHEQLGEEYIWDRNYLSSHGAVAESPGVASVTFYAGYGSSGSLDPTRLTLHAPVVVRINKRHSRIVCQFDQGTLPVPLNPAVLVHDCELWQMLPGGMTDGGTFYEIKRRPLHKHEYSDNSPFGIYTGGNDSVHKYIHFKVHHPPNAVGIQYYFVIRALGDATATSPTTTDTNTGADGPPAPSSPSGAYIITNVPDNDPVSGHARLVFRVFAVAAQNQSFRQAGVDSCYVVLAPLDDPGVQNSASGEKHKYGGPITYTDPSNPGPLDQNYIDIEVTSLTFGKGYYWRHNKNVYNGAASASPNLDYLFYAGGSTDISRIINFSFGGFSNPQPPSNSTQFNSVDAKHGYVYVQFQQPNPPSLVRRIKLWKQVVNRPDNPARRDTIYTVEHKERLLDDPSYYQPGVNNVIPFKVHYPRGATVQYIAELEPVGTSPQGPSMIQSPVLGINWENETTYSDGGPPAAPSGSSYLRWNTNHLRIAFNLPSAITNGTFANMNTHTTNRLLLVFQFTGSNGFTQLIWDPTSKTLNNLGFFDLNQAPYNYTNYMVDIGKQTKISFNNRLPTNQTEFSSDISSNFDYGLYPVVGGGGTAYLYAYLYVFNQAPNSIFPSLAYTASGYAQAFAQIGPSVGGGSWLPLTGTSYGT